MVIIKETVNEIYQSNIYEREDFFTNLHAIVDSPLDGDRLDYISRDLMNSGFDSGKIEYDRLITPMRLIEEKGAFLFCPDIKSLNTVEDVLFRRWILYKNIIYHHRVVKTDYLLRQIIKNLTEKCLTEKSEKDSNRDSYLLESDISGLWKVLKGNGEFFLNRISQWDDSWLITVLKKYYFEMLEKKETQNILFKQLEELLTGRKYYFSAIKRLEDFLIIDKKFSEIFSKEYEQINKRIEKLNKLDKLDTLAKVHSDRIIDSKKFIERIKLIASLSKKNSEKELGFSEEGLSLSWVNKFEEHFFGDKNTLIMIANECAEKLKADLGAEDVVIIQKLITNGLKEEEQPIYLFKDKSYENELKKINILDVSPIKNIINKNIASFSQFYVYILNTKAPIPHEKVKGFLEGLGTSIANKLIECIKNEINRNIIEFKEGV